MKNEPRVFKGSLFQRTIKETSQTAELFDLADIKDANGIYTVYIYIYSGFFDT